VFIVINTFSLFNPDPPKFFNFIFLSVFSLSEAASATSGAASATSEAAFSKIFYKYNFTISLT